MAEETSMSESPSVGSLYNTSLADIKLGMDPLSALQQDNTPFVPPIPDGTPIPPQVNNQLTGDYLSGPNPGANANVTQAKGTLDYTNAAVAAIHDDNWAKDPYKYGRTYSYGAGYKAMNFDRYYDHNKFKSLGFSPYRDNDAYYNEKGSWWDDFERMSGQWLNLAWSGAKSIYGDEKIANEEMQRGMLIGSSTKGGVGAWITNFGLNSAYTVGIIGEIWAENMALAAIEAASMTTATPEVLAVAAARNTMAFSKLGKGIAGISNFIKEMKAANSAKEFFNWAKLGEVAKGTANFINPFERTFSTTKNILKGTKGFDLLENKAKLALGFGDFYRDIREINVAHSEARLEGEGALVDYQDHATDEFYALNGRMPNAEESKDIFDRAQAVKGSVVLANDIGIYLTNKIAFHDLFEGIRPTAKLTGLFTESFKDTIKKASMKGFKIGATDVVTPGAKIGLEAVKDFAFKSAYSPLSRKYFLGNLGEALQENYQEVVQKAAIDYYSNIQKDPSQAGYYNSLASIGKGLGEQFSGKGLDTFLQGYLMGTLIQAGGAGLNKAGEYMFKSKEQREQTKTNRKDYINNTVNAVNTVGKNVLAFGSGAKLSDALAEIRQGNATKRAAKERGDEKAMHDAGDDVNINHLHHVVSSGNTKILVDHFDDMLSVSDEDLLSMAEVSDPSAAPEIRSKIQKTKERLIEFDKKYKYQQKTAPNPYNPDLFDVKKNPDAYYFEHDRYNAYEQKMKDILFATEDHGRIAERLSGIYNSAIGQTGAFKNLVQSVNPGNAIANTVGSDITMLLDPKQRNTFLKSVQDRISILSSGTAEQKKEAKELEGQQKLLNDWVNLVHNVLTETKLNKRATFNPIELAKAKERSRHRQGAKVKTNKGEEGVITDVSGDKVTIKLADKSIITADRSKLEVLQDSNQLTLDFEGENVSEHDFAINTLYNTYEEYIKHVSKTNNGYIFNNHLHDSFRHILDFLTLELDKEDIVSTINALNDPTFSARYEGILTNVEKIKREQDLAAKVEALNKFLDLKGDNDMLNELYDLGIRILPEDVEKLKDFTIVDFYDQTGKEYLDYSSDKYKQVISIVEKYAEDAHRHVTGYKIEEEGQSEESLFTRLFNAVARPKLKNDTRLYRDIAKQFGFSSTAKETKVNTRDVLKAITESKFATDREKVLARRLLTLVTPENTISFVRNLTTAGEYNVASEELMIDARYSSNEFGSGKKGNPIEHVILNNLLHSLTRKGLITDSVFAEKISKLRQAAIDYQKTPEYKNKFGDKPLFGLINNIEFITAALTNDTFQSLLKEIPYTTTGKVSDTWTDFVNSVKKFFSRLLGINISNSLLDQALYIITSKIDAEPIGGETKDVKTKTPEVNVITPIQDIKAKDPVLYNKLLTAYKAYAKREGKITPTTDTEIEESLSFKNFIESHSDALDLINATGIVKPIVAAAPVVVVPPIEVVPSVLPKEYKDELEDLIQGFNPDTSLTSMSSVSNWGIIQDTNEVFVNLNSKDKFRQWTYDKIEETKQFKEGKESAVKIAEELRRLQALLDEQIRELNDKYNIETEEVVETTAGVFTPTTPYGTPTGKPVTTATTPATTDAKADIERRRQEKLENNDITVEDRGDNYYSLVETKGSVISFEERNSLIGKKVNFIVKNPSNNKLIDNYKGTIIKHESAGITGDLRIDLELDNGQTFSIDRNGNYYTQSNVRFTEEIPNIVLEINAKYDAELAALEGKVTEPISKPKEEKVSDSVKTFNSQIASATVQDDTIKKQRDERVAAFKSGEKDVDMRGINAYLEVRGNNIRKAFKELFKDKPANNIINTIENLIKKGITIYQKRGKDDFTINNYTRILEKINKLDSDNITDLQLKDIVDSFILISSNLYELGNTVNYNAELADLEGKKSEVTETEPYDYKGITVIEDSGIRAATGEPGAAQYNSQTNLIKVNSDLLKIKFQEKAWTKPRKQSDNSSAQALPVDTFKSFEEWKNFVIEHEFQHSLLSRNQFMSIPGNEKTNVGQYEDYINNQALITLGLKPVTKQKSLTESFKDINNLEELDAWYERGIEEGIPAEILDEKRQEKVNELAKSVKFTDLIHGKTVEIIADNKPRVVYDPTGNGIKTGKITLLFYGDWLDGNMSEAITVTPETINSVIKFINNDAMKEATSTTPTITKEQVEESDNTIDSLTKVNVVDEKVIDDMVNKATSTENVEDLWNAVGKEIDDNTNCLTE